MELNSKDTYKVILDDYRGDDKSLFSLYLPVVGYKAIALYMTLCSEGSNQIHIENHDRLSILLNMSIDEIFESRIKLEEIMLLKSFVKESSINEYIYQIVSPLSITMFLKNDVLSKMLLKSIGPVQYEITASKFLNNKPSKIDYKDITSKFSYNETNKFENEVVFSQIKPVYDFNSLVNGDIDFDYESFIRNTSSLVFPIPARNEENLKLIGKLATLYGLSENTMSILVGKCSNYEKGTLDIEKLKGLSMRQKPEKTKCQDPYMSAPIVFLQNKQHGLPVTSVDARLLDYLSIQLHMKHEVINVLIEYVLDINQNKLPRNYVEKIAGEWIRDNINSKQKALDKVSSSQTSSTNTKSLKLPEYYEKEIVEDSNLTISDEKIEELKDRLKRI